MRAGTLRLPARREHAEMTAITAPRPLRAPRALRSAWLWVGLLFLGSAALGAWFLIKPAIIPGRYYKVGFNHTTFEYAWDTVALFVPWAGALWAWRHGSRVPLWVLVAGVAVLHFLVLFAPLPQSQDLYQYLFYGKMQVAHHANPYVALPASYWADSWLPWARWHLQTSVYGPAWMLVSAGVARIAGPSLAVGFVTMKLVIFGIDMSVVALLLAATRTGDERADRVGRGGWALLAFAWNPLVFTTVPVGASVDILVAAAFLGALIARRRGHATLATVLVTIAALTKAYAAIALVLHVALLVRERGWGRAGRDAAIAAAIGVACYAPYWAGPRTLAGLVEATRLTNLSLTGTIQQLLVPVVHALGFHGPHTTRTVVHGVAAVALLGVIAWGIRRVRSERDLWYTTIVVFAAYLCLTPWFLSWYALGALALVAVLPTNAMTLPMLVFSGSSLGVLGNVNRVNAWVKTTLLRYAPPVVAYVVARRRTGASRPGDVVVVPARTGGESAPVRVPAAAALSRREPAAR